MELTPFFFGLYKFVKYGLYPLTWVVLLLGIATVLALFPFSPTRLRWVRKLLLSALLLLVALSSPLIATPLIGLLESWYHPPQLAPTDRFDAIVVLGGGVDEKGSLRPTTEPSSYSRNRTTCGVDLYQQGYAPTLVLTGGDARIFGPGHQEAIEMKRWAIRLGVPESATRIDTEARNTYENVTGTKPDWTRLDSPCQFSQPSATRCPIVHEARLTRDARPLRLCFAEPTERKLG